MVDRWRAEAVGNVAWAGRDMGIFVLDWADSKIVKLEALANTDVIVCSAVLNQDRARTASPSAAVVSMRSVQI